MAWSRKKVDSQLLNNNNEYTKDSLLSNEALNGIVNSGLYSQDFVEHLADTPDVSEAGNVGTPSVSLVSNPSATSDKPYKRFKFSNLKGEKGDKGDKGDKGEQGGLSGGTLTGDIRLGTSYGLVGVTTSGNNYDVFRVNSSNGTLTIGGTYPALALRGKNTRPQYNSSDIAMLSDLRTYQSIVPAGTPIPTNADLNTVEYLKVGSYYNNKSAEVKDFTNCPTKNAFMMTVYAPLSAALDTEETGGYVYRVRKILDFLGNEYIQAVYSGATAGVFTYGTWKKILTTADVTQPQMIADGVARTSGGYTTWVSSDGKSWYVIHPNGLKLCGISGNTTIGVNGWIDINLPVKFTSAASFVSSATPHDWLNVPLYTGHYIDGEKSGVVEGQTIKLATSSQAGQSCTGWRLFCAGY